MFRLLLASLLLFLTVGCASVTGSKTQTVSVTTVCEGAIVPGVACHLKNDKGQWLLKTPEPALIQKSYGNLSVVCTAGESSGSADFVSKSNGATWGNILAGGLIGYAVDSSSGAGFDYPGEVTVVLASPCPALARSNLKE